ncbi:MAG: Maf family protein, partial [Patescibacteria group bacterium]
CSLFMKRKIILASTSPRRKELLRQIGLDFEVVPSDFEEDMSQKLSNKDLVMTLALGKAKAVADKFKKGIVIGADTFVVYGGKRIGKPKDKNDARKMLRLLSGKTMKIYSGLAVIDVQNKKELLDCEVALVKMSKLSNKEIDDYIKTGEPLDKAGAFAVQGIGDVFIEKISGCYSSVVGLPLRSLYKNLKKLGINIFDFEN